MASFSTDARGICMAGSDAECEFNNFYLE